jgi:hypothetical protein
MMAYIVRRLGKALRQMQDSGMVARSPQKIKGEFVWKIAE